jgi:hypothetical protein
MVNDNMDNIVTIPARSIFLDKASSCTLDRIETRGWKHAFYSLRRIFRNSTIKLGDT